MEKRVPEGYNTPDGCWSCYYTFLYTEYDEGCTRYCTRDKSKRPPCGSVAKSECFGDIIKASGFKRTIENGKEYYEKFGKLMDEWEKWSDEHRISDYGICPKWEHKEVVEDRLKNDRKR